MGAVGVVRSLTSTASSEDVWISLTVMLRKTEGSGLSWGSLKVVEVAISFLIVGKAGSHVVEDLNGEVLSSLSGEVGFDPTGIEAGFVHTDKTDGGEVVLEGAKVMLGVWI